MQNININVVMYTVSITSQGQISIPAAIRAKLGLKKAGKAIVREENGKMIIEPIPDFLSLKGSLKTTKKPLTSKELHEFVAKGMALDAVKND